MYLYVQILIHADISKYTYIYIYKWNEYIDPNLSMLCVCVFSDVFILVCKNMSIHIVHIHHVFAYNAWVFTGVLSMTVTDRTVMIGHRGLFPCQHWPVAMESWWKLTGANGPRFFWMNTKARWKSGPKRQTPMSWRLQWPLPQSIACLESFEQTCGTRWRTESLGHPPKKTSWSLIYGWRRWKSASQKHVLLCQTFPRRTMVHPSRPTPRLTRLTGNSLKGRGQLPTFQLKAPHRPDQRGLAHPAAARQSQALPSQLRPLASLQMLKGSWISKVGSGDWNLYMYIEIHLYIYIYIYTHMYIYIYIDK